MSSEDDESITSSQNADGSNKLSPEQSNLATLKDILSANVLNQIAWASQNAVSKHAKKKRAGRKDIANEQLGKKEVPLQSVGTDTEDLADFFEYLATELFASLPLQLRQLEPDDDSQETQKLRERYAVPLDSSVLSALMKPVAPEVPEGLATCLAGATMNAEHLESAHDKSKLVLEKTVDEYCEAINPAPASLVEDSGTATLTSRPLKLPPRPSTGCELCARAHIPLTVHHLIPRSVHAKAVKRAWHSAEACQTSIAWLCRACHSYVHSLAGNEELARDWFSVDRLEAREDVQRWIGWVSRVRWKAR